MIYFDGIACLHHLSQLEVQILLFEINEAIVAHGELVIVIGLKLPIERFLRTINFSSRSFFPCGLHMRNSPVCSLR